MVTTDFDQIISSILEAVDSLAKSMFTKEVNSAEQDAHAFIIDSEEKLYFWFLDVKAGQLSLSDLSWLVQSQLQLGEMTALKDAGVAETQLDGFQSAIASAIVNIISNTA